jgi:CRP/FNR family transcriptional regulator, cyclic AMP receptor protein
LISPDQLKQVPLFADLDERELESLAATLHEHTFEAGEQVTVEGKPGVGFFVIKSGEAVVEIGGRDVRTLSAGDYFGEIALLAQSPRTATITATMTLRCHGLMPWELKPLVEDNPTIAWKLLQRLAQQIADAMSVL